MDEFEESSVVRLFRTTANDKKNSLNCSEFPNSSIMARKGQINS